MYAWGRVYLEAGVLNPLVLAMRDRWVLHSTSRHHLE